MPIFDILSEVKDTREENGSCKFNGYLEDYISLIEEDAAREDETLIFRKLLEKDSSLRICVDLQLNINKDAIANQIIRYKDSFKLPKGTIQCSNVVYVKNDLIQRALILKLGQQEEYVMAKALYYVMSEPENEYEGTRNEIISTSVDKDSVELLLDTVKRFFYHNEKAGIVQRSLDAKYFLNYEEMYDVSQKMASYQLVNLKDILLQSEHKEETIDHIIANWFLLKKFSYVQYMMDKNNLNKIHDGNVKRQRQAAKEKCDAIGFVSYSELWKLVKETH